MSCEPIHELIALDAGGDLDEAAVRRLEEHLSDCPDCREFAAAMVDSHEAVRGLADVPIGEDLLAGVRESVLREIDSSHHRPAPLLTFPRRISATHQRWLAAAAMVLVAVGTSWWLMTRSESLLDETVRERRPAVVRYEPPSVRMTEPRLASALPSPAPPAFEPEIVEPETTEPHPTQPSSAVVRLAVVKDSAGPEPSPPAIAAAEAQPPQSQPLLVKWQVDDPDLVIYWLIETDENNEEMPNASKEA